MPKYFLPVFIFLNTISINANAMTMFGQMSCGNWVKYKTDTSSPWPREANNMWLLGFISGLSSGIGAKRDFLSKTDADSITLYMDNYCQTNPLKSVVEGAYELTVTLQKKH